MTVRVYYLEQPLSGDDVALVAAELGQDSTIEQVRIPHVLPVLAEGKWSEKRHRKHETLLRKHLRAAGITHDCGSQVILVAPLDLYWYSIISGAVEAETGAYPWLVQTEQQREAIGNPGSTRILDMEGLSGRKD